MAQRLPYLRLYTGEYLSGTRELSAAARGVYMDLLCYQWQNGSLPSDKKALARLSPEVADVWGEIRHKFVERDGRLYNERLESERADVVSGAEARSERARKGAAALHACRKHAPSMPPAEHAASMPRAYESVSVSDSVSGFGSGSGESVRGGDQSAIDSELDAIAASNGSALAHALSRDTVLVETWGKIPRKFATERTANMPLLANAVREAQAELGMSREDAAAHVAGRIVAYCDSDTGRTEYRGKLSTWLKNGRWRESDDAWKRAAETKPERKKVRW